MTHSIVPDGISTVHPNHIPEAVATKYALGVTQNTITTLLDITATLEARLEASAAREQAAEAKAARLEQRLEALELEAEARANAHQQAVKHDQEIQQEWVQWCTENGIGPDKHVLW